MPTINSHTTDGDPSPSVLNLSQIGQDVQNLDKIVVGEITKIDTIIRSKGLKGIMVDCGTGTYKTVSTAANLKVGMKAPFAELGAVLHQNTYVQIREISGVESRGKLCSAFDLGVGDGSDTVLELPGELINGTRLMELFT